MVLVLGTILGNYQLGDQLSGDNFTQSYGLKSPRDLKSMVPLWEDKDQG